MMYATRAAVYIKIKKPNVAIRDANAALEVKSEEVVTADSRGDNGWGDENPCTLTFLLTACGYIWLYRKTFITHDCIFLESQKIIDYSLLLGLHFRAPEHLKAFLETSESIHKPEHTFDSDGTYGFHGYIHD